MKSIHIEKQYAIMILWLAMIFPFKSPAKDFNVEKGSNIAIREKPWRQDSNLDFYNYYNEQMLMCRKDNLQVKKIIMENKNETLSVSVKSDNKIFTVNGVSFMMVRVIGGKFKMGATGEQRKGKTDDDEWPVHNVSLSTFFISETEVTQALWKAVMEENPSKFSGNNELPVEHVSWDDCQIFLKKLSEKTGIKFRLPTEAEWEYAARGGKKTMGTTYAGSNEIEAVAWYDNNSYDKGKNSPDYGTHPVKSKAPNEIGLYDMTGNVWEWCSDWYGEYSRDSQSNPQGAVNGVRHVMRGGGWIDCPNRCRISNRVSFPHDYKGSDFGLRLAM